MALVQRFVNRDRELQALERAHRRAAMEDRGEAAWKPEKPRKRQVSTALKAYAAMTTSAARGAVRDISQLK